MNGRRVSVDVLFAPWTVALALYVPLLVLYLALPSATFSRRFSSMKWEAPSPAIYFALAVVLFAAGAALGDLLARRPLAAEPAPPGEETRARVRRLCLAALVVAILAYGFWYARGIVHAGGVGALLDLFRSDPQLVKTSYLTTVAGATTLMQLAVAAIPLAIAYRVLDRGLLGALVALTVALAVGRSVLASERLAVLELAVPIGYLLVAHRRVAPLRLAAIVVSLLAAVVAFFVFTELRRKGAYGSFGVDDALWRLSSYYMNTINNAFAVADHDLLATPAYFSTEALWQFPGVSHLGLTYDAVTGIDASRLFERFFRDNAVTPTVNTFGVPGEVAADFGWAGLLWILGIGGVAGALYRTARRDPFYRALYAVWLVGVLEFLRIYYFFSTRLMPAYLLFAAAFVLAVRRAAARSPHRLRMPEERAEAGTQGGVAVQ